MPRAIWSGTISFGLVSIPVKLHAAVSRKTVRFNQIDTRTRSRVRQKRVAEADGAEVPNEDVAKGYQLASGQYVIVTEDELAALDPEASRTIEITEFVDLTDIDPVFYDAAYLVAPDQATVKPYALLTRVLADTDRVAIARFVMRSKEYLAAIRAVDGHLVLSTMVYADELNDPADIPEIEDVAGIEVSDRELTMANQLVESMAGDFDAAAYRDTHRERVHELIEAKAEGATEVAEPTGTPAAEGVVDLMAALEESVAAAKQARSRHPSAPAAAGAGEEAGADEGGVGAEPGTETPPARRSA